MRLLRMPDSKISKYNHHYDIVPGRRRADTPAPFPVPSASLPKVSILQKTGKERWILKKQLPRFEVCQTNEANSR